MLREARWLPVVLLPVAALLSVGLSASPARAQGTPEAAASNPFGRKYPLRIYETVRLEGQPPTIDGRLDDEAWREGEWTGDFTQQKPNEGAPPSQPTEFKVLYDDENVYTAIRAFDELMGRSFSARRRGVGLAQE